MRHEPCTNVSVLNVFVRPRITSFYSLFFCQQRSLRWQRGRNLYMLLFIRCCNWCSVFFMVYIVLICYSFCTSPFGNVYCQLSMSATLSVKSVNLKTMLTSRTPISEPSSVFKLSTIYYLNSQISVQWKSPWNNLIDMGRGPGLKVEKHINNISLWPTYPRYLSTLPYHSSWRTAFMESSQIYFVFSSV